MFAVASYPAKPEMMLLYAAEAILDIFIAKRKKGERIAPPASKG